MKCVQIVLFLYAIFVVTSEEEESSDVNITNLYIVRNIDTDSDESYNFNEGMNLSEARNIMEMSPANNFFRHYIDTTTGDIARNSPISISKEDVFTIGQITYNDDMIFIGSIDRNIILANIDETEPTHYLKINDTLLNSKLGEVRKLWTNEGIWIQDNFFKKKDGGFAQIQNEDQVTLREIRVDGKVYHGSTHGDISRFLRGLTIASDGELLMTSYKVAHFKKSPRVINVARADYKTKFTSDERVLKMLKSGVDELSASVGGDFFSVFSFSVDIGFSTSYEKSSTDKTYKSYNYASYIVVKQEIEMDEDGLVIHSDAYKEIENALLPRRFPLQNALALLAFLQKYGWFVPVHYKTGGSVYDTKISEVRNKQEAFEESNKFSIAFTSSGSYKGVGVSADGGYSRQRNTQNSVDDNNQRDSRVLSIKGGDGTSTNVESFGTTLSDPKKWEILEYKRFLPTLMLLRGYNNRALSRCLQLLSEYHTQLQTKEDIINIQKYSIRMQQELYEEIRD